MIMHLLGLKKLGRCNLHNMFGTNPVYTEPMLKQLTTRLKMETFM